MGKQTAWAKEVFSWDDNSLSSAGQSQPIIATAGNYVNYVNIVSGILRSHQLVKKFAAISVSYAFNLSFFLRYCY